MPDQHGDDARQVVARLAGGLADAQVQVGDVARIEPGTLASAACDHLDGEVVRTHVLERALDGAADRRAGGGDDDCFGHEFCAFRLGS